MYISALLASFALRLLRDLPVSPTLLLVRELSTGIKIRLNEPSGVDVLHAGHKKRYSPVIISASRVTSQLGLCVVVVVIVTKPLPRDVGMA